MVGSRADADLARIARVLLLLHSDADPHAFPSGSVAHAQREAVLQPLRHRLGPGWNPEIPIPVVDPRKPLRRHLPG